MSTATDEVIETAIDRKLDMRTAAFVNAINKLHQYYQVVGVNNWEKINNGYDNSRTLTYNILLLEKIIIWFIEL